MQYVITNSGIGFKLTQGNVHFHLFPMKFRVTSLRGHFFCPYLHLLQLPHAPTKATTKNPKQKSP